MTLLKTVLGTTLIAIGLAATSNIAFAGSHEKPQYKADQKFKDGKRIFTCKPGHRLVWKNNKPWCFGKGKGHNSKMNNTNKNTNCKQGYILYKNDANNYKCLQRQLSGWRPVNHQLNNNGKGYTEVEWTLRGGKKYAVCRSGYKAFFRGNKYRCYKRPENGWKPFVSLKHDGGNGGNGGGMSMQKNTKYDNHRYFDGKNVKCRKGNFWVDNRFMAHCGGS